MNPAETSFMFIPGCSLRAKGFCWQHQRIYQTNNTILSALGQALLWKETGNDSYLELSQICLINVVSKFWIWEPRYGSSREYSTFLGLVPLHDAPYLAAYEEGEALKGIIDCIKVVRHRLLPSLQLMLCEYAKYLASRGKYYFPEELPPDSIATQPKEGRIRTCLWIPLEDIRFGWELNGQVGQEVYGSAFPLILTTCMYVRLKEVPFVVFCEYPVLDAWYNGYEPLREEMFLRVSGVPQLQCRLRLIGVKAVSRTLGVHCIFGGEVSTPDVQAASDDELEMVVPGGCHLSLSWQRGAGRSSPRGDVA